MCRHLAYLGPPTSLAGLLFDAPHSLRAQAEAPRLQPNGPNNPDGFGYGWYAGPRPTRFRDVRPIWAAPEFAARARALQSGCFLASVRLATPGFPVELACTQPFRAGPYLFSHNGKVAHFATAEAVLGPEVADVLDPDLHAPVDSALLARLAVARLRNGLALGQALADVVATVAGVTGGRLNLLATHGRALAGTAYGNSLFVHGQRPDGGGVVIASEPCDDAPGWRPVPPESLVVADAGGVHVSALPDASTRSRSAATVAVATTPEPDSPTEGATSCRCSRSTDV